VGNGGWVIETDESTVVERGDSNGAVTAEADEGEDMRVLAVANLPMSIARANSAEVAICASRFAYRRAA